MNKIPPLDLACQYQTIREEIDTLVLELLASGRYIGGPPVDNFEQAFASYLGTTECIACNSGTDALYLALRALQIGPGDEVITTPFSFIATAEAISMVGATPVFVDITAATFNLDPQQVAAAITPRTRAILPVHLFGQPADLSQILAIAQTHHLAVIEDCAQAVGATWAEQKVGSIGTLGCFSFYPTKNLGACGDGGAVTTADPALAAQIRQLRDHGRRGAYYHEVIGMNSRLDALQAVILQVKLRHLDLWNQHRRQVAQHYLQRLQALPGIVLPQELEGGEGVWNQFTLRILATDPGDNRGERRDRVRQQLQTQGIGSMVYYPLPLHLQPVYQPLGYQPGDLPIAEQAAREVLSLPMFPELTVEDQDQVIHGLKDALAQS